MQKRDFKELVYICDAIGGLRERAYTRSNCPDNSQAVQDVYYRAGNAYRALIDSIYNWNGFPSLADRLRFKWMLQTIELTAHAVSLDVSDFRGVSR